MADGSKTWSGHQGPVVATAGGFDVIDCAACGFKHCVPIPTPEELERAYSHEYYSTEKPLYIERYREDLEWWNSVYARRYDFFEQHLPEGRRSILDIGSGPGFFLLNGQKRGWRVKGVEPSAQAAAHSRDELGLDVESVFYDERTAARLGVFDVINMGEVLEHIPDPAALLALIHGQIAEGGILCIVVPNDFSPFQLALRDSLGFKPWWVAPPHHLNYFDFKSLAGLVERCGFNVLQQEATFPIDMFLLMGDNYIGNDELGRACHKKRKNLELALAQGPARQALEALYASFAKAGIGREVVLMARKGDAAIPDPSK